MLGASIFFSIELFLPSWYRSEISRPSHGLKNRRNVYRNVLYYYSGKLATVTWFPFSTFFLLGFLLISCIFFLLASFFWLFFPFFLFFWCTNNFFCHLCILCRAVLYGKMDRFLVLRVSHPQPDFRLVHICWIKIKRSPSVSRSLPSKGNFGPLVVQIFFFSFLCFFLFLVLWERGESEWIYVPVFSSPFFFPFFSPFFFRFFFFQFFHSFFWVLSVSGVYSFL